MAATDPGDHIDREIRMTHERFIRAMEQRLPTFSPESKAHYFGILSVLVGKLETDGKPLREIVHEMMTEAATLVMREMQG